MKQTLSQRHGLDNTPLPRLNEDGTERQIILGEPQRLAMEWLMGGGSITEAGQYAGVSRQTVSQWLNHDEDFRALFEQWQQQVREINHARLMALSEAALETVAVAVREKRDPKLAVAVLKGLGMLGPGR
jgi:hypothetical protein